jgi:hypothetical protein
MTTQTAHDTALHRAGDCCIAYTRDQTKSHYLAINASEIRSIGGQPQTFTGVQTATGRTRLKAHKNTNYARPSPCRPTARLLPFTDPARTICAHREWCGMDLRGRRATYANIRTPFCLRLSLLAGDRDFLLQFMRGMPTGFERRENDAEQK